MIRHLKRLILTKSLDIRCVCIEIRLQVLVPRVLAARDGDLYMRVLTQVLCKGVGDIDDDVSLIDATELRSACSWLMPGDDENLELSGLHFPRVAGFTGIISTNLVGSDALDQ